jgi:hypothetical protein
MFDSRSWLPDTHHKGLTSLLTYSRSAHRNRHRGLRLLAGTRPDFEDARAGRKDEAILSISATLIASR